jgi:transposase InsO family protein
VVADFSYGWTLAGFCYVALPTDVYSRRILGWRVSTSKATPLVLSVLEQALFTRRRTNAEFTPTGLVHHSDSRGVAICVAGVHRGAVRGRDRRVDWLGRRQIGQRADGIGDRTVQDRTHRTPSSLLDPGGELERETAGWVHWYNGARLHSAIGYRPPIEYEQHFREALPAASTPEVA